MAQRSVWEVDTVRAQAKFLSITGAMKTVYYVLWRGFAAAEATWEPRSSFTGAVGIGLPLASTSIHGPVLAPGPTLPLPYDRPALSPSAPLFLAERGTFLPFLAGRPRAPPVAFRRPPASLSGASGYPIPSKWVLA